MVYPGIQGCKLKDILCTEMHPDKCNKDSWMYYDMKDGIENQSIAPECIKEWFIFSILLQVLWIPIYLRMHFENTSKTITAL